MRRWLLPLLLMVGGCAYVSKAQFLEYWDADHDKWPIGQDCDDDATDDLATLIHPGAPDIRGDKCDEDCNGLVDDADGDDWPDDADCAPDDPNIYPCAPEVSDTDEVDNDCDGLPTTRLDVCFGWDPNFTLEEQSGSRVNLDSCECPAPFFGTCPGMPP
jgi:hypothetical protein